MTGENPKTLRQMWKEEASLPQVFDRIEAMFEELHDRVSELENVPNAALKRLMREKPSWDRKAKRKGEKK